ncbi:hypothetical protein J3R82DRAFT_7829 [Butyriboletus roseoflavus]|nr:hypothetical protein J3R82DRAFT_7829 [Butyriboletus roseoflavus]
MYAFDPLFHLFACSNPPEDVPVVSTTSDAMRELKPIEDEDADLDLVYPEDAAEVTCTSSSKPQTESSPPTTLRELFKDGLQAIPALQNLAVVAYRSPPRRCRMPGCNEVLRAQTCMQRCVKCSVGAWKRRTSANMDTLGPSRRPNVSSSTTDTSMEAKTATNMLEEILDVEDDLSSSSPSKSSSNDSTGDHGVSPVPGWDSDLTESSCSESDAEGTSDLGPKLDPILASPHGGTTDLRIHIPLLATRLPPGSPLRKCGNKRCNIALPKGHRWKTCDPCRRAQRMRFENKRRSITSIERVKSPDLSCQRWRSLSRDMRETDVTLTTETSRPCSVMHCRSRIPLSEVHRCTTCTSCRARARREARRKRDALDTQHASRPPEVVPRFPAYQNRGALLASFEAQIKGFVEGQIMYFRAKLHDSGGGSHGESEPWKPQHTPMTFVFVGEYSMVTGQKGDLERSSHDRDPYPRRPDKPGELEAMRHEMSNIVLDFQCLLHAKFRSEEAFAIDKGGIIMRFTSSLELITQLRPLAAAVDRGPGPGLSCASESEASTSKGEDTSREDLLLTMKPPPNPPTVPLVKIFSGELETIVVPDESHRLFYGRRTVVRYRMVG